MLFRKASVWELMKGNTDLKNKNNRVETCLLLYLEVFEQGHWEWHIDREDQGLDLWGGVYRWTKLIKWGAKGQFLPAREAERSEPEVQVLRFVEPCQERAGTLSSESGVSSRGEAAPRTDAGTIMNLGHRVPGWCHIKRCTVKVHF